MPSYKPAVRMLRDDALKLLERLKEELAKRGITHTEVAGSIRREETYVGDIDLMVEGNLSKILDIGEVKESGETRVTLIYEGQQINLFAAKPEYWGAMLLYLTGPKGSAIGMRMKARARGWSLNQYGLFDKEENLIAARTEKEIFDALGHTMKHPSRRGK